MSDVYLSDNAGGRSSPTPESSQPETTQTAVQLSGGTAGTDETQTVIPGKKYRLTSVKTGGFYCGLATVATGSEANVRWVCPIYRSVEIRIPQGSKTLHFTPDTGNAIGFLVELQ